jgi:RNA polymerase sigma-70 factor (ECF subfamily)
VKEVEAVYRAEARRVFATLVRLLGDFDRAEEALHDAFRVALERWPTDGVPENPRAWLVSTGRFKAIDRIRHLARLELGALDANLAAEAGDDFDILADDPLRLIFTCCHPALAPEAQIALTLREVCGLTTEEIARAFLVPAPTLAQRIVRAKTKIREARIPYEVPGPSELAARLEPVLRVIYLVFTEGHAPAGGSAVTREGLTAEAIRLARLLVELLPEPEVVGLLALLLLHEARREARSLDGEVVLLEQQDRSRWDAALIAEGSALVESALRSRRFGAYTLQAAIAAVHAEARTAEATDWPQIVGLYDLLLQVEPSPVVELNRAVALAKRDGAAAGLAVVDDLAGGALQAYALAHSARAELLRQLGRDDEAVSAYRHALALTRHEPERRFLAARLAELAS